LSLALDWKGTGAILREESENVRKLVKFWSVAKGVRRTSWTARGDAALIESREYALADRLTLHGLS
jgi:hypothetical protein